MLLTPFSLPEGDEPLGFGGRFGGGVGALREGRGGRELSCHVRAIRKSIIQTIVGEFVNTTFSLSTFCFYLIQEGKLLTMIVNLSHLLLLIFTSYQTQNFKRKNIFYIIQKQEN